MRFILAPLRSRLVRRVVLLPALVLLFACAAIAGIWAARSARAIADLDRGIGDTVFHDAAGMPWFRLDEQRLDVAFDAISPYFRDAVVAIEDHRFYRHPGIDPIGLARAAVQNLRSDDIRQGGSTITQQLARTLFLSNARTWSRKVEEAGLALLLELTFDKREILRLYMNRIYLSGGIYGVETMSQRLFGRPASDLTLGEAALIAGVIRAPALYSPWTRFEAARSRSHVVLQRMREEGLITPEQEAAARAERIRVVTRSGGAAARHGYAKEYLRQQFRALYGDDNPANWTVHTTFVPELQDAAEAAVRTGLRQLGIAGLQAALVAIDPRTGGILAMVGGADFAAAPFNRAVHSRRQPGSAFKPLVYAVALDRGFSPVSVVTGLDAVAVRAGDDVWIPRDQRDAGDSMTLRDALAGSRNAAAVVLQQQVGTRPVVRLAAGLGVTDQPEVPSLALGSGLVSPLDLTAAYTVFPTLGHAVRPRAIVSVADAGGTVLHEAPIDRRRVLPAEVAFQMVTMLQDVVDRGTGAGARALGVRGPVGGKTGTTNEYRDAWFVGFSGSVVVGVWTGFDQPRTIGPGAVGARVALPIWADFMRRTARLLPAELIEPPPGVQPVAICRLSGHRAGEACPAYTEYFKRGDTVPGDCPLHGAIFGARARRALDSVFDEIGRSLRDLFTR